MTWQSHQKAATVEAALCRNEISTLRYLVRTEGISATRMMHFACDVSSPDVVRELVSLGATLGALYRDGTTALHLAAAGGRVDICKALVEAGADPLMLASTDRRPLGDPERYSPFQRSVYILEPDVLRYFIVDCGIDPASASTEDGKSINEIAGDRAKHLLRSLAVERVVALELKGGSVQAAPTRSAGIAAL